MIIVFFVVNELRYDRHHENAHRIFRINSEIIFGGNHYNMTYAPAPLAETLPLEFPEVEAAVHFRERGSYLVKREVENIKEKSVIWAGKDFFKIFTVPLLEGNPEKALEEPNTMAISKRTADKFFPGENALGQTLILDNKWNFKITGVYEDMPATSHFHFDLILSIEGLSEAKSPSWLSNNFQTYMLLRPDADPKAVEEKLMKLVMDKLAPQIAQVFGNDFTMEKFRIGQ